MARMNIDGIELLCDTINSDLSGKIIVVKVLKTIYRDDLEKIKSIFNNIKELTNADNIIAIPHYVDFDTLNIDDAIKAIEDSINTLNRTKSKLEKMRNKDNDKE